MILDFFSEFECALFLEKLPNFQDLIALEKHLNSEGYYFSTELPGYVMDNDTNFLYPRWSSPSDALGHINKTTDSLCLNFEAANNFVFSIVINLNLNLISLEISEEKFVEPTKMTDGSLQQVNEEKLHSLIRFFERVAGFFSVTYWRIDPSEFDYEIENDFVKYQKGVCYPPNRIDEIINWYNNIYLTRWE